MKVSLATDADGARLPGSLWCAAVAAVGLVLFGLAVAALSTVVRPEPWTPAAWPEPVEIDMPGGVEVHPGRVDTEITR